MRSLLLLLLMPVLASAQKFTPAEITTWKQQAQRVTIIRDNWGVPHIYGKSDADAVFGLLYAQCEDDFARVEANYIEKLGRQAEVAGSKKLYEDLLHRLVLDSAEAKRDFAAAQPWLQKLCIAFADGINFYLATHPDTRPALLQRFEPWWPLMWTDGSIGAISTGGASLAELKALYSGEALASLPPPPSVLAEAEVGSNGFAFAPKLTQNGQAILYINPHVTFYFRPEVHMVSEEGLNAYGAVTWGQFFVYQGFNPFCGWMHTSSKADVADLYSYPVQQRTPGHYVYPYADSLRPVQQKSITISVNTEGRIEEKRFTTYATHHGPVVARRQASWLALRHHNRSMASLVQSWQRTKVSSFAEFRQVMDLRENTSNNTVYADAAGNIAYWHGNFMPRRNPQYNWNLPVDGTTPATEWQGLHAPDSMVTLYNPASGWIQNCNQTPFSAAGASSPRAEDYPEYMAPDPENFRGINAVRVWSKADQLNLDKVIAGGYTTYLPAFDVLLPALQKAWANRGFVPDSLNKKMAEAVAMLMNWDKHSGMNSVAASVAIEWGEKLVPAIEATTVPNGPRVDFVEKLETYVQQATPDALLAALQTTLMDLQRRFGTWKIPWGQLNVYQRLTGKLQETYTDSLPATGVAFAAAKPWGALPSYVSSRMQGSNRRYGYSGNSFICAVEFGNKVKAKSLLAGGNSNNPKSKHFADQASMYATGKFKDVLFYKEDVLKHQERVYKPGQK